MTFRTLSISIVIFATFIFTSLAHAIPLYVGPPGGIVGVHGLESSGITWNVDFLDDYPFDAITGLQPDHPMVYSEDFALQASSDLFQFMSTTPGVDEAGDIYGCRHLPYAHCTISTAYEYNVEDHIVHTQSISIYSLGVASLSSENYLSDLWYDTQVYARWTAVPAPEPSLITLLGLGLVLFGVLRRKV